MRKLEAAVTEQQKIFIKRGNLDPKKQKLGQYLIQMPSDKIAAICVMHLMKHLFKIFSQEHKLYSEEFGSFKDETQEMEFMQRDLKIPAIDLFLDLGKLFEQELKNSK